MACYAAQCAGKIAAKLERDGQIALALQYGERLLADDPLREHAHRQLMRLHYLRGDRAAALGAFERCRDLLKRELATAPGKETLELAALIESSDALPSPAPVAKPVSVLDHLGLSGVMPSGTSWKSHGNSGVLRWCAVNPVSAKRGC